MSLACRRGLLTYHYRVGATAAPDYSVQDHEPIELAQRKYLLQPASPRFSEIKLANMEIYRVIGNTCPLEAGDILEHVATERSTRPAITVYQITSGAACLAFKTDRVGNICHGTEIIYENIKFAFLPSTDFSGRGLNREITDSLGIPSVEAITFKKDLYTSNMDGEGLYLQVTDAEPNLRWVIANIVELGYAQVLTLKRDW